MSKKLLLLALLVSIAFDFSFAQEKSDQKGTLNYTSEPAGAVTQQKVNPNAVNNGDTSFKQSKKAQTVTVDVTARNKQYVERNIFPLLLKKEVPEGFPQRGATESMEQYRGVLISWFNNHKELLNEQGLAQLTKMNNK